MTDRENFLERWSRRKREAAKAPDAPDPAPIADDRQSDDNASAAEVEPREARGDRGVAARPASSPAPDFDLSSLPSLDSITATTDVRAFLKPGVPPELTREALRRAWSADPVIRNFVGLQEYDWDFNDPTAAPGFGDLPADYDLRKMVAEVFGHPEPRADKAAPDVPASAAPQHETRVAENAVALEAPTQKTADIETGSSKPPERAQLQTEFVQHNTDIAPQKDSAETVVPDSQAPRKHGRALPK
jgi:hypothetical protein